MYSCLIVKIGIPYGVLRPFRIYPGIRCVVWIWPLQMLLCCSNPFIDPTPAAWAVTSSCMQLLLPTRSRSGLPSLPHWPVTSWYNNMLTILSSSYLSPNIILHSGRFSGYLFFQVSFRIKLSCSKSQQSRAATKISILKTIFASIVETQDTHWAKVNSEAVCDSLQPGLSLSSVLTALACEPVYRSVWPATMVHPQ